MTQIDITPPNRIYGTFARLNYKPWYAIAEFVDNSTQNFYDHAQEIANADGTALLDIDINYSPGTNELRIRDNANGMNMVDLERALKISTPPADTSGRSEFGMGLKTAACWFGPVWSVETTRLNDPFVYSLSFDVEKIGASTGHTIEVQSSATSPTAHYTEIVIHDLHSPLAGRQIQKVKDTVRSMYRRDLDSGTVEIRWNGAALKFEDYPLFEKEREDGSKVEMRQSLDFFVIDPATNVSHHVTGWVGVLSKMSSSHNGFALLRRGRLILGLPGECWRPQELVGAVGSPEWKRLVGELEVDSFPVNFTKDGFHWEGGLEEALIEVMAPLCSTYRNFAKDLRTRPKDNVVTPSDFQPVIDTMQEGVNQPGFKTEANRLLVMPVDGTKRDDFNSTDASPVPSALTLEVANAQFKATLYLKELDPISPWMKISNVSNEELDIVLNIRHPFIEACTTDERGTTILGYTVLALAIAEQMGRVTHGDMVPADEVRMWMDTVLRTIRGS